MHISEGSVHVKGGRTGYHISAVLFPSHCRVSSQRWQRYVSKDLRIGWNISTGHFGFAIHVVTFYYTNYDLFTTVYSGLERIRNAVPLCQGVEASNYCLVPSVTTQLYYVV